MPSSLPTTCSPATIRKAQVTGRIARQHLHRSSEIDAVAELERLVFEADLSNSVELTEPFPERWTDHLIEMVGDYIF